VGGSERADNGGIASIQEPGSHEDQDTPIFVQLDRLQTTIISVDQSKYVVGRRKVGSTTFYTSDS
jgi:hypothetical protein